MIACKFEVLTGAAARAEALADGYVDWVLVVQWRTYSDGLTVAKVEIPTQDLQCARSWVVVHKPRGE